LSGAGFHLADFGGIEQKSTDFYPKMISGLVICPVSADETLG